MIRFRNEVGEPRFVAHARWWTEVFNLERFDGTNWTAVPYEPGLCDAPCPTDGPGEMHGYADGEPADAMVEFELTGADATVDLEVGGDP